MNHIRTTLSVIATLMLIHGHSQVVINEVSASNLDAYPDGYGEFEDWIELYNPTGATVDISGWYLSDSQNNNTKWQIPPGTTIGAGGHRIFFASGRPDGMDPAHTSFKISQGQQERAVLSNMAGTIVDNFQLANPTMINGSRGRTTDGAATWSLFLTATPGAANTGSSPEYTAKPVLSPAAGPYAGAQNVTMSSPVAGAAIHYTLDGSTPGAASPLYSAPVNIAATTVVRAIAIGPSAGIPNSFIETNTYLINTSHTIPVISASGDDIETLLNGNGGIEPFGVFEYFVNGQLVSECFGQFDEHGQDSWAYDQRGVDYTTRDQTGYGDAINYPVFRTKSRPSYQRVIIKAAAGDNYEFGPGQPAHIRDAYVQALSQIGRLHLDERTYEPAVLYANGKYWGVYDIREKVDDADFTKYYYGQDEYTLQYVKTWGGTWSEYGGPAAQTDWDALVNFINTNNMGDPTAFAYVDSLLSWKSLVDYFCINSYTVCSDWLNWNTGWWRGMDPNGQKKKWRYTLWDMDATFDHYANFTGLPDQSVNADPCQAENLGDPGGQGHTTILDKLITENQMVHDYYVNRYIDLGNSLFSCNVMLPFLDSLINNIAPEMAGQVARWGGSVADWQANVLVMRTFIEDRCVTIQQGMVDCYDVTGPYDVCFEVDPPGSGEIMVNSLVLPNYPFQGLYYGGITTTLAALPDSGWTFGWWQIDNDTILPSVNDSLAFVTLDGIDCITAHFIPPVSYDVMLLVDPPGKGTITFDGVHITSFPHFVSVSEGIPIPMIAHTDPYHDFLYWELKNNNTDPGDSTISAVEVSFYDHDTIIAHLIEKPYAYYVPNSFTPNGDGHNDTWIPMGSAVDLETFDLVLFNRWGELVYSSDDPYEEWDGTYGGSKIPGGVYAYRIELRNGVTKQKHELFGNLTIFR